MIAVFMISHMYLDIKSDYQGQKQDTMCIYIYIVKKNIVLVLVPRVDSDK